MNAFDKVAEFWAHWGLILFVIIYLGIMVLFNTKGKLAGDTFRERIANWTRLNLAIGFILFGFLLFAFAIIIFVSMTIARLLSH